MCGSPYQDPVDITRNVDIAQFDAINGPRLRGPVTQDEGQSTGRPTRRNPTNDTDTDATGDPSQKATPDTGHLADSRKVRERQPLHASVRQTCYDTLK